MRGLYAIVDVDSLSRRGLDPVRFAESVLGAQPAALQIRAKNLGARATLELLRAVVPLATELGVPLYENDRPDLALLAGAHGVHVGQDDLPVSLVRKLASSFGRPLHVGLSTHNEQQVDAALRPESPLPDYLAMGPVFGTTSKERPDPTLGRERLATLAARARALLPGLPLVAIGGITLETAPLLAAHVDALAVIQALLPSRGGSFAYDEARELARALHDAILGESRN